MPNIDPQAIRALIEYMNLRKCDIGTLASELNSEAELKDQNVVKVVVEKKMNSGIFTKALDFSRSQTTQKHQVYHHIGIYAFTSKALLRYVSLKRSKLELERRLEQLRALENNMSIHVGYINSSPLSVDTETDLIKIKKLMEKNE
jgi:3-deoxy-manno-octulosonate cytidylyltransferase (CMP-KDO synthetase)